ncbi:hypothetical protein MTO96_012451 [Rhipicephalus appendiculatus]
MRRPPGKLFVKSVQAFDSHQEAGEVANYRSAGQQAGKVLSDYARKLFGNAITSLRTMDFFGRRSFEGKCKQVLGIAGPPDEPSLRQPDAVPTQSSFMLRSFVGYARFYRFFGCLFISDINDKSLKASKVTWKSVYTLYTLVWLTILAYNEGYVLVGKFRGIANSTGTFALSLDIITFTIAISKVVANMACLVLGSGRMLKFLRDAGKFERSIALVVPRKFAKRSSSWLRVTVRLAVLVSLVGTSISIALSHRTTFASSLKDWHPLLKVLAVCSSVVFMVYESSMYVTVTCFCGVLLQYLKAQIAAFDECRRMSSASSMAVRDAAARIEAIRLNVSRIKEFKDVINDVWCPAIVTSSVSLVAVLSMALCRFYNILRGDRRAFLGVTYSAFGALCFVDMVLLSSELGSEVQKLKDAAKTARLLEATDSYSRQVRYLHEAIEPDDMCLNAGGFFPL